MNMSRNINKQELISKVRELAGLTNDEKSALLELLNEKKVYGLVWENHEEAVEEQLREQLPVFREVPERRILSGDADAPNHIIIEAENLHALVALTYTHAGRIDVMYLDPPYNTGNKDFVYNDSYVDSEDSYRHSKWLSFMEKRLKIAMTLLSDKGVVFISIDDNEQANLKILCDEIFGHDHYVACIAWQRTYSTRNDSKGMPKEVESVLVYSKQPNWTPKKLPRTDKMNSLYKSPDNDPRPWTSSSVSAPGAATHQGMVYAIQHPFTGEMMYPTIGRCWSLGQDSMLDNLNKWCSYKLEDLHDESVRAEVCGISVNEIRQNVLGIILDEPLEVARDKAKAVLNKGNWPYFYFTNGGKGGLRRKTYLEDMEGRVVTNFFSYDECGHTDEAKKEVISIFDGKAPFDTPKPTRLLKRVFQIATDCNSTILDFFAGSGTTMHAAMQLNAEDGGHRQCILVTNNENGICENVTYERNKRVIQGYSTPKGEQIAGLTKNNLRYYKADFIARDPSSKNKRELVKAATDLLCIKENLYEEVKVTCNGKTLRKDYARRFADGEKEMIVIYEPAVIKYLVEELETWDKNEPIKIYVFSEGRYAFDDDFKSVIDKVTLCALPDAIYQAYRRVLPRRKKAQSVADIISEEEQAEAIADAEQYSYKEEKGGES
jgi:adenine-specific DNA-methyltransferase